MKLLVAYFRPFSLGASSILVSKRPPRINLNVLLSKTTWRQIGSSGFEASDKSDSSVNSPRAMCRICKESASKFKTNVQTALKHILPSHHSFVVDCSFSPYVINSEDSASPSLHKIHWKHPVQLALDSCSSQSVSWLSIEPAKHLIIVKKYHNNRIKKPLRILIFSNGKQRTPSEFVSSEARASGLCFLEMLSFSLISCCYNCWARILRWRSWCRWGQFERK